MENVMTLVATEETVSLDPAMVVEKKETYRRSELVLLREDIANYVRDIKVAKAEARALKGIERHEKKLYARKLGEKARWRYLCYALLRGRDITNVERSWRDLWNRQSDVANAILFYIPKEQYQFWGMKEIGRLLNDSYVLDKERNKWCTVGKVLP